MSFEFEDKHLKQYPHFDQLISKKELTEIVVSPDRVRAHSFWPFLEYAKTNRRFRHPDHPPPKTRIIRYAARIDAGIFIYYRYLLSQLYERQLDKLGISHVPTAYRNIPKGGQNKGGKCNIDFAHDAFSEVRRQGDCVVVTLDISSYFDCIDHGRLRRVWANLLGEANLPDDHYKVFKAITAYTSVDCARLYHRLGILGPKIGKNGIQKTGFIVSPHELPKQLCSPEEFREKVAGKSEKYTKIISPRNTHHGIPQGAPLSDLVANAYLLEFDHAMSRYAEECGGRVWRYSDDIIMVIPGGKKEGRTAKDIAMAEIEKQGPNLKIKDEKTALGQFRRTPDNKLSYEWLGGNQGKNGLDYLGFRFDGKRVFLRDTTLSNFQRKITKYAKMAAFEYVRRYPGQSQSSLVQRFIDDAQKFEEKFGRVTDFEERSSKKDWTFWTYAKRAEKAFADFDCRVLRQLRGYRRKVRYVFEKSVEKRISRAEQI